MRFTSLHSTITAAGYPQSKPRLGCIRIQDDEVFIIWEAPRIALVNPNPNPLLMPARMVHPYGAKLIPSPLCPGSRMLPIQEALEPTEPVRPKLPKKLYLFTKYRYLAFYGYFLAILFVHLYLYIFNIYYILMLFYFFNIFLYLLSFGLHNSKFLGVV